MTYQYGDTVSFAYRYDPSTNEDLAVYRDQQVEELKKDFEKSVKKKIKEQGDKRGNLFHKDTNYAMLFDSAVYETGNGALSMAIYAVEYNEVDRKMEPVQTSVQTYLLNKDTMLQLNPMQLLTPDYKEKAATYFTDYLNKSYKEEELRPDADVYLKEDDSNYNQIVLSDGEMTVFFDEGTVVDASEGVVSVTMPKVYLGTSLRSQVITRYIDPDKPMVAITYDDGPGGDAEKKILKTLKKYGAVATFFYVGNRIDYDKENVKTAYELGCEIANHSWDHSDLTGLSAKGVKSQMKKTNKAIKDIIGVKPELYRPPYGSYNDSVLEAAGMPAIIWDVDTEDWRSRDAKAVFKVIKKTKKLDGKIILMHSIYGSTASATKKIIPYLQKKGYQLVTVSELIKYKTGEAPKAGHTY
ncbi:MAG: polysaccharide deacetylase family protein [Firmicutes bacterium]|nr:polysaccharide deacetylase family protein [Bacillota bacterium]